MDTIPPVSRTCVVLSGYQALPKCLSLSPQLTIVNTTLSLPLSHEKNERQFKSVAEQRPHWDGLSSLSACHHNILLPVNKKKPKDDKQMLLSLGSLCPSDILGSQEAKAQNTHCIYKQTNVCGHFPKYSIGQIDLETAAKTRTDNQLTFCEGLAILSSKVLVAISSWEMRVCVVNSFMIKLSLLTLQIMLELNYYYETFYLFCFVL